MNNTNSYIALTIGPIYKTFSKARRVKEFWFVSFLFSQIMNRITKQVFDSKVDKKDIVLPFIENEEEFEIKKIGLFPDWLIFKSTNGDFELLIQYKEKAIRQVAIELVVADISQNEIEKYLLQYLKVYYFEQEVAQGNPILALSPTLHQIELQNPLYETDNTDLLLKLFRNLYKTTFYKNHYRNNNDDRHESMEEIATRDLKTKLLGGGNKYRQLLRTTSFKREDKEDKGEKAVDIPEFFTELIDAVKNYDKTQENKIPSFKSYHKYVAIVKADGDKIGETLKNLDAGQETGFSQKLFNWGKASIKLIEAYEGVPLFIGGDDVLFFAPVVNGSRNILELIKDLNILFAAQFQDYSVKPSLSFGVSVTFYKYPLFEAMENVDRLLYDAKDKRGDGVSIQLLKHSGSSFKLFVPLQYQDHYNTIIEHLLSAETKLSVVSATAYYLRENEKIFETIGCKPNRIISFFENNIEGYKKSEDTNPTYQESVCMLVQDRFKKGAKEDMSLTYKKTMNEVYDTLRFTKFLKGFDENER